LKKLYINLLLLNCFFLHYFNSKSFLTIFMQTKSYSSESSLSKNFSKQISLFNIMNSFKFFIIIDSKHFLFLSLTQRTNSCFWAIYYIEWMTNFLKSLILKLINLTATEIIIVIHGIIILWNLTILLTHESIIHVW
jgi:hypothetical protein